MPAFDLSISLGQLVSAAGPVIAIIWGVAKMSTRTDEFFRALERHEEQLQDHDKRLVRHGESIAALKGMRLH